jgi:hypothetical protein
MAKEKIVIIGDSFSADVGPDSWITMLSNNYNVIHYSQRGISEYRLYCIIKSHAAELAAADHIVIFHTNSLRVYIPDAVDYPTRKLNTHGKCDLVINDAFTDPAWSKIAETYYRYFFDEQYLRTQYQLLVKDIHNSYSDKIIHCTGFAEPAFEVSIKSFADTRTMHPGSVNHLDCNGNIEIYQYIKERLC